MLVLNLVGWVKRSATQQNTYDSWVSLPQPNLRFLIDQSN
jgi:hypothetical protein